MHNCVAPFTSHCTLCRKTNLLSQTDTFWLFLNKFYCLESHTEHCWRCSKSSWACWIVSQAVVWFLRCVTIGIQPTTRVFFGKILLCLFFTWKYLILMYSMVLKWRENDPNSPGIQIIKRKNLTDFYNRLWQVAKMIEGCLMFWTLISSRWLIAKFGLVFLWMMIITLATSLHWKKNKMVQLTLHIWMDYKSDLECHLTYDNLFCFNLFCFVGPCPHRDGDYGIGSNFWKFYFIRTSFTLDELVSLVKVFKLFRMDSFDV